MTPTNPHHHGDHGEVAVGPESTDGADLPERGDLAGPRRRPGAGLGRRLRQLFGIGHGAHSTVGDGGRWRVGWTVRLDWPDGSHDLIGFHPGLASAQRKQRALHRFWRAGPLTPTSYRVVPVDETTWRTHTRPQVAELFGPSQMAGYLHRVRQGHCINPTCPGNSPDTHSDSDTGSVAVRAWSGRASWSSWISGSGGKSHDPHEDRREDRR